MPFLADLLHHPRRLFLRKALFQIHLWAGVFLSLYVVLIALSGSILVFKEELTAITLPVNLHPLDPSRLAGVPEIAARFRAQYPGWKLTAIIVPTPTVPAYQLAAEDGARHSVSLAADPQTGDLYRVNAGWIEWVHDFHLYLLLPHAYGAQVNAVGAAVLMLLAVSGIVLWWPGQRAWRRGLRVNLRAGWRRINFDSHNAIGFWTLAIVFWWSLSGYYFGFYKQVAAVVNSISPLRNMRAPHPLPRSGLAVHLPLAPLLEAARAASPAGHMYSVSDPLVTGPSIYVAMDLARPGDFLHRDIVVVDTGSGRILSLWHYANWQSFGDWVLWSMYPLHYGTLWGLTGKIVWALLGVLLAGLSVSGLLMYWNRFLRHRWKTLAG